MAALQSSTEIIGGRLLKEIAVEEGSLEDVSLHFTSALLIDNDIFPFTCLESYVHVNELTSDSY